MTNLHFFTASSLLMSAALVGCQPAEEPDPLGAIRGPAGCTTCNPGYNSPQAVTEPMVLGFPASGYERVDGLVSGTDAQGSYNLSVDSTGEIILYNSQGKIRGTSVIGKRIQVRMWVTYSSSPQGIWVGYITGAEQPIQGIWRYNISYGDNSGPVMPVCGVDQDGMPNWVYITKGEYNKTAMAIQPSSSIFTMACEGTAVGKCAYWKYQFQGNLSEVNPNDTSQSTNRDTSDLFNACIKLTVADYCGTGFPHTRKGATIGISDTFHRYWTDTTSMAYEAEWAADGGHCIQRTRFNKASGVASDPTDLQYIQSNCPQRLLGNDPSCSPTTFDAAYGYSASQVGRHYLKNFSQAGL